MKIILRVKNENFEKLLFQQKSFFSYGEIKNVEEYLQNMASDELESSEKIFVRACAFWLSMINYESPKNIILAADPMKLSTDLSIILHFFHSYTVVQSADEEPLQMIKMELLQCQTINGCMKLKLTWNMEGAAWGWIASTFAPLL